VALHAARLWLSCGSRRSRAMYGVQRPYPQHVEEPCIATTLHGGSTWTRSPRGTVQCRQPDITADGPPAPAPL